MVERQPPRYPEADTLSISCRIGPGDPSKRAVLGEGALAGVPQPVRAVFFVNAGEEDSPVLFVPDAPVPCVLVPGAHGGGGLDLHPRTIADDRHRHQGVAAYAYLTEDYQRVAQCNQGLVVVGAGPRLTPRVLAASRSPLVPDRCYRALGWASPSVVLFECGSQRAGLEDTVRYVLAWDVLEGRPWQVAAVDRAVDGVGELVGDYAL